jgi:SEC-C motif
MSKGGSHTGWRMARVVAAARGAYPFTMKHHPGRNDLCSCGSGRKYKNCCAGKNRLMGQKILGAPLWIVLGIVGVAVASFAMLRGDRTTQPVSSTSSPAERPAPWTYDSTRNQHFDPAHGHWHDGRPPGSAGTSASVPTPTPTAEPRSSSPTTTTPSSPQPWEYDSAKNQHWDPSHQHWHPGLPPAGR